MFNFSKIGLVLKAIPLFDVREFWSEKMVELHDIAATWKEGEYYAVYM